MAPKGQQLEASPVPVSHPVPPTPAERAPWPHLCSCISTLPLLLSTLDSCPHTAFPATVISGTCCKHFHPARVASDPPLLKAVGIGPSSAPFLCPGTAPLALRKASGAPSLHPAHTPTFVTHWVSLCPRPMAHVFIASAASLRPPLAWLTGLSNLVSDTISTAPPSPFLPAFSLTWCMFWMHGALLCLQALHLLFPLLGLQFPRQVHSCVFLQVAGEKVAFPGDPG